MIFTKEGFGSLFAEGAKIPLVLVTIFAFSLTDTFDTIGTFIGTGRRSGIYTEEDEKALETSTGFKTKMEKALFADSIATSWGNLCTSNTTTGIESAAGISEGVDRLTSVVTAIFIVSAFVFVSAIPMAATAPASLSPASHDVVVCGYRGLSWRGDPAFFAAVFMAFSYSNDGIATAFIFYCIVKLFKKQNETPILWIATLLFILNFICRQLQRKRLRYKKA